MIIRNTGNRIDNKDGSVILEMIGKKEALGAFECFSISKATAAGGFVGASHYHKHTDELYYVIDGRGDLVIDGTPHRFEKGTCILVEHGERHYIKNSEMKSEFVVVCCPAWEENDCFDG